MTSRSSRPPPTPKLGLETRGQQNPLPFAESCLPLTMELADRHRTEIEAFLDPATAGYPFEDRVLLVLAPYWRADVETFHQSSGSSLQQAHEPHKLLRFDEHYREQLQRLLAGTP